MRSVREPLVLPALCFAAGIGLWSLVQPDLIALKAGLAACVAFWLLALLRFPRLRWFCALASLLAGGWLLAGVRQPGPDPRLDVDSGEVAVLGGCVAGPVSDDGVQLHFTLELESDARAAITLTSREGEKLPAISYGRFIEIEAKVRRPHNFGNPGAFDYRGYLRRNQVFWLASARGVEKLRILPGVCASPLRRAVLGIRSTLSQRIAGLYKGDEYAARLMPALLIGDNSSLDRSWTADFRRTGTYHAIVISGLHITVVAGAALFFMRVLSIPLTAMLACAAVLTWTYAGLADWQPPVVRSAVGFTFFLLARWFFREGRLLNLLALTSILLLAYDPSSLYDPSVQLTFLSVAAIAALASPLIERSFGPCQRGTGDLENPRRDLKVEPEAAQFRIEMRLVAETISLLTRVPVRFVTRLLRACLWLLFWVMEMATISACVQLALTLPMVAYFHQVSATGILANLVVVPALSAAVPVGLLAAALNSSLLASVASFLLRIGRTSTEWWAAIEPGLRVPDSPLALQIALALTLGVLGATMFLRVRWRVTAVPAFATLLLTAVMIAAPFAPDLQRGSLEVTTIDVGQGDSLLVVFPDMRTLLIDGGGFPVFDKRIQAKLDIGEDVVSPYLWRRGIRRLDYVAITHLHDDHAGGMPAVIRNFRPKEVWLGSVPASSALLQSVLRAARDSGSVPSSLRAGIEKVFGTARVKVLSPSTEYVAAASAKNDDSLVMLLANGRHRFLLTGDAESLSESNMEARGLLEEVDVLKAAHHGSRTSTIPSFLDATRPLFALISVGEGNTYGHPHPGVIQRFHLLGTRIFRTDEDGLIRFTSNGSRLAVTSFRAEDNAQPRAAVFGID